MTPPDLPALLYCADGLDFDAALDRVAQIADATGEDELVASIEPTTGLDPLRDTAPEDLRWQVVVSSSQREDLLGSEDLAPLSSLEMRGWVGRDLEDYWALDFLLSNALRYGLPADMRDAFREQIEELTDALAIDGATLDFTDAPDGMVTARCAAVEQRLADDDSWRAALPALTTLTR